MILGCRRSLMNISPNIFLLVAILLASVHFAEAQHGGKFPRVGILEPASMSPSSVCISNFRQALGDLGYLEKKNIVFDSRFAESKPDRLPELARELVQLKPDVIWTHSPPSVRAAKEATTTIPIVVGVSRNLVEEGIVASLSHPGGNITGMELLDGAVISKRLEILKETLPRASNIAVLVDANDPSHAVLPKLIEPEARHLKVTLRRVEVNAPEALDKAFASIVRGRADAILLPESVMFANNRRHISELAISERLPTAAGGSHFADAGSLLSYGANVGDLCRRSATLVDKILKGGKPVDLPVERAHKFEFVINLETAKQIGVTVPPNVMVRADRIIK